MGRFNALCQAIRRLTGRAAAGSKHFPHCRLIECLSHSHRLHIGNDLVQRLPPLLHSKFRRPDTGRTAAARFYDPRPTSGRFHSRPPDSPIPIELEWPRFAVPKPTEGDDPRHAPAILHVPMTAEASGNPDTCLSRSVMLTYLSLNARSQRRSCNLELWY